MIHIDPAPLLAVLDERGWTQGTYNDDVPDAPVCLHGAIRLCSPQPGDAHIIEHVLTRQGHGPGWNDRTDRTEAEVREYLSRGVDVTDADLADTFGPQWEAVVEIVRTSAAMTGAQAGRLDAAGDAARDAAGDAAWAAAGDAARDAAWAAAWDAAGDAAWDAAGDAAGAAAWDAARDAARNARNAAGAAAWDAVVWDLATADGPFTYAHRDLLIAPWVAVFGLPTTLTREDTDR